MSKGVNKVILIGRLGEEPSVKYLPSGGAVTNISVATSESWKDKNTGQTQERTEWIRVVFFKRLAEIAGEYLRKGSKVYIEGSLRTRKWQAQDGTDRYSTEIVASELNILDSKSDNNNQNQPQQQYQNQQQQQQYQPQQQQQQYQPQQQPKNQGFAQNGGHNQQQSNYDNFDDDIPFAPIGLQFGKRSVLSM